jgi:dihydroflavonol-4-reductase
MNPPVIHSWAGVRACVVGGTGFLGYQIADRLAVRGAAVRVLAPVATDDHPIHSRTDIEWVVGDVRTAAAKTFADCRAVFQAAGPVQVGIANQAVHLDSHTAGTCALLAALPAGCRLVHTSSLVAIGGTHDGRILDESSPFPNGDLRIEYVRAKRTAEAAALAAATAGADVVVTNPAYLIGPDDFGRSVMGKFCIRVWQGRVPFVTAGGYNVVDVRDAAEGHVLAAERGRTGERYVLGGENLPLKVFVGLLTAAAGLRPRAMPTCPAWLFAAAAGLAEVRGRILGKAPYPSFEHARLNRLSWYASAAKAARELGFAARPVTESIADAFRWHAARRPLTPSRFNRWWFRPPRSAPATPAP